MVNYEFKLPDIGEGVVEGEIVTWHVAIGSTVKEDDALVDVMTDKATVTIPSPVNGVVSSLSGDIGDMVAVGTTLISFDIDSTGESNQNSDILEVSEPVVVPEPVVVQKNNSVSNVKKAHKKALASPAVRRRARENGINLTMINGTGPAGRIRHSDIDLYVASNGAMGDNQVNSIKMKREDVTEIKVVGLRRKIAEQMVISKRTIPHFSYFEEIDITELEKLRQTLNGTRDESQPKLTYLPFIMLALTKIMPQHPECNARYDDQANIVSRFGALHIGIATQTERGLYVPVVKHVETLDIWQTASEMQRVSGSARNGTASLDELSGSTFTITSLGRDGGLGATPIINHPEVAILGVHNAREMPVVRDGNIVIRRIMNVSSSFDHRVVDGADGAALIQNLKRMLETPALIFI